MSTTRRSLIAGGAIAVSALPTAVALFPFSRSAGDDAAQRAAGTARRVQGQDVTDFGAKGDGTTDDAAAIRAAAAAVVAVHADQGGGGVLHFPAGIYAVGSPLVLPKNLFLTGDGPIASRLLYTGEQTEAFLTFGKAGAIATFSGVKGLWVDAQKRARTGVLLFGPQEGSTISEAVVTGATRAVVEVRSSGIEGGSNKFVIDRCWFWTDGDDGRAGVVIGAGSGPLSIRDSTMVGTNRTEDAPALSAGIVASGSVITLDNVNVERFESHTYLDRTQADIRGASGFFNRYGVRTSPQSVNDTLLLSNADFDRAEQCVLDQGSGVTLRYARSYWNEPYQHDRRNFRRNFWEIGSVNVYRSDTQQATIGYTSPGTRETTRFKFTTLRGDDWVEAAAITPDGTFGSAASEWDGPHLRIGTFHLWVDTRGRLRMKNGAPEFETDGDAVRG